MMKNPPRSIQRYKDYLLISINPKIYPLRVVHSAAYAMIDRAYVILDGDPAEEIFVEIRPKNKKDMKDIELQFANELLNYAVYYQQSELNKEVRNALIQRVFLTHGESPKPGETDVSEECKMNSPVDDPLGIAKQWTPAKKVKK